MIQPQDLSVFPDDPELTRMSARTNGESIRMSIHLSARDFRVFEHRELHSDSMP